MSFESINWWLDIEEYITAQDETGRLNNTPYNSFSVGPIKRAWGLLAAPPSVGPRGGLDLEAITTMRDDKPLLGGTIAGDTVSVEDLVTLINNLFADAWDHGNGKTTNLYELIPYVYMLDDDGSGIPQFVINYKFIRSYPPNVEAGGTTNVGPDGRLRTVIPDFVPQKTFRIRFISGPHGSDADPVREVVSPSAVVTYTNRHDTQAVLMPYWAEDVVITDKPPVPPDVVFVPFLGITDKILLLMDANIGDLDLAPVMLRDTDAAFLQQELYSQLKLPIEQAEVRSFLREAPVRLNYKSDDPVTLYQIFRVSKKPTSYDDFNTETNPIAVVSEMVTPNKPSVMATFVDSITPNTKYYYCIRAVDVHGNISNPTEVFVIEMVDNNGQIFYTRDVLKMGIPPAEICKQYGDRFIRVTPAPRQLIFDREVFNNSNEVHNRPEDIKISDLPPSNILGQLADGTTSVWGKKFKVRVTSAKTGKKFDLNITIKNTGVTNP